MKKSFLYISLIVIFYSIISFINLGSTNNPQSFYTIEKKDEITFYLDNNYLEKIWIYTGRLSDEFQVYFSLDNKEYKLLESMDLPCFYWGEISVSSEGIKSLKFINMSSELDLGSVVFFGDNNNILKDIKVTSSNNADSLFDEKDTIPKKIDSFNSMYWDEVYFARSAYEYVNNYPVSEWTHPPLGKLIQSIPLIIFGNMSPFYYRLMGNIAGILMVVVIYLLADLLFKNKKYALLAALFLTFDTFHLVQSRLGTTDAFLALFIMLSFYYMFRFIINDKQKGNLLLSGLFFGLSTSIKWIGLYCGMGLCIIFFWHVLSKKILSFKIIIKGFLYFVFVPFSIYLLSYFIYPNLECLEIKNLSDFIDVQLKMFKFHSELSTPHYYGSSFYSWPLCIKTIRYFSSSLLSVERSVIVGVGNIILWWMGAIAVLYNIYYAIQKKDKNSLMLIIAVFSLYVPNFFINRPMFIYHFFTITPFYFLCIVNMFKINDFMKKKKIFYSYLFVVILFFIVYFPLLMGIYVPNWYIDALQLLPEWLF